MGYELHIARAGDGKPITPSAFEQAAARDGRPRDVVSLGWDKVAGAPTFVWRDPDGPSLYWVEGEVRVKGVRDKRDIAEIAGFAKLLGAMLLGDDEEIYDETGDPIV